MFMPMSVVIFSLLYVVSYDYDLKLKLHSTINCDFLCRLKTVQAKLEDSIKEAEEEMKQYAT